MSQFVHLENLGAVEADALLFKTELLIKHFQSVTSYYSFLPSKWQLSYRAEPLHVSARILKWRNFTRPICREMGITAHRLRALRL